MPGTGWKAASEATLRIAPARRSTIGAQERERELVHGRDVELHHRRLVRRVGLGDAPVGAEAGVVAQPGDELLRRLDGRDERAPLLGVGEVGGHGQRLDAVLGAQRRRELLEPVGAPRDEDELVPERGELPGELRADARTRRP